MYMIKNTDIECKNISKFWLVVLDCVPIEIQTSHSPRGNKAANFEIIILFDYLQLIVYSTYHCAFASFVNFFLPF